MYLFQLFDIGAGDGFVFDAAQGYFGGSTIRYDGITIMLPGVREAQMSEAVFEVG